MSRDFNHASSIHQRSFRDGLESGRTRNQKLYEENKVESRRTSSLGVLTPNTEAPEVP